MITKVVTSGLNRFSLDVLRERARLALDDPAGEVDAVAPLSYEQAFYNHLAAVAELARRDDARPIWPRAVGGVRLEDALGIPAHGQGQMRCPAHEDRNASMHWSWSSQGNLLVHCYAGCTFDEIRGAVLP